MNDGIRCIRWTRVKIWYLYQNPGFIPKEFWIQWNKIISLTLTNGKKEARICKFRFPIQWDYLLIQTELADFKTMYIKDYEPHSKLEPCGRRQGIWMYACAQKYMWPWIKDGCKFFIAISIERESLVTLPLKLYWVMMFFVFKLIFQLIFWSTVLILTHV